MAGSGTTEVSAVGPCRKMKTDTVHAISPLHGKNLSRPRKTLWEPSTQPSFTFNQTIISFSANCFLLAVMSFLKKKCELTSKVLQEPSLTATTHAPRRRNTGALLALTGQRNINNETTVTKNEPAWTQEPPATQFQVQPREALLPAPFWLFGCDPSKLSGLARRLYFSPRTRKLPYPTIADMAAGAWSLLSTSCSLDGTALALRDSQNTRGAPNAWVV